MGRMTLFQVTTHLKRNVSDLRFHIIVLLYILYCMYMKGNFWYNLPQLLIGNHVQTRAMFLVLFKSCKLSGLTVLESWLSNLVLL